MSIWAGGIRTQFEYHNARRPFADDVARSLPDRDSGVYIRGPQPSNEGVGYGYSEATSDWEESTQLESNNPVRPEFGRRRYDMDSSNVITKKLVVATVILVNAFFLAGDALLTGPNFCP